VYTLGSRADLANVLVPPESVGAALVRADRGGDVTYHGPGQLVGYPLISLAEWRARPTRRRRVRTQARSRAHCRARRPRRRIRVADRRSHGCVGRRREGRGDRGARRQRPHPARVRAQRRSRPGHVLAQSFPAASPTRESHLPRVSSAPRPTCTTSSTASSPGLPKRSGTPRSNGKTSRGAKRPAISPRSRATRSRSTRPPKPRPRGEAGAAAGSAGAGRCRSEHGGPAAGMDAGACAFRRRVSRGQAARARPRSPHRVRVGRLSEHLRVLGRSHATFNDPRRPLQRERAASVSSTRASRCRSTPASPPESRTPYNTMGLEHAVITCVARDDLDDGGATVFARTIAAIREQSPRTRVEVLISDCHAIPKRSTRSSRPAPTCWPTTSRRFPGCNAPRARRPDTRVRSRCWRDRRRRVSSRSRA